MRRNPSPASIAIFGGLICLMLTALIAWLIGLESNAIIVLSVSVSILSAIAFYVLVLFFVQRKIEQVYHNIYRFKARDKKFLNLVSNPGTDPMEEMSSDVLKWMQQNKREILELKTQAKFRREFVGNVSHELKTPIMAIQGYVHTLLDGALEDAEVNRKFLKKAGKAVDRLAELVDDLTQINLMQSGKMDLEMEKFDFGELIQEVFDMVENQSKEHEITLSLRREGARNLQVLADRKQIMQVVTNLVVNGIKYGKPGGTVEVICKGFGSKLLIDVKDDGEGIGADHLPRLFDRFYRVDRHRNREEGGSGLGLSITKHIIEAHQEVIEVHSELGKGTTFSFTLAKA